MTRYLRSPSKSSPSPQGAVIKYCKAVPVRRLHSVGVMLVHAPVAGVQAAICVRARMTAVPCGAQDVGMRSGRAAVAAVAALGVAAFVVLCVADGTDRPPGGCLP